MVLTLHLPMDRKRSRAANISVGTEPSNPPDHGQVNTNRSSIGEAKVAAAPPASGRAVWWPEASEASRWITHAGLHRGPELYFPACQSRCGWQ